MTYPEEILNRFKPFNRIHLDWGLRRLEELEELEGVEARRELEAELFGNVEMDNLFPTLPEDLRCRLLRSLSPERFADIVPRLTAAWETFSESDRRRAGEILLEIAPDRAAAMFEEWMARWTPASDSEPWDSILALLDRMPPADAERIGRAALERLAPLGDELDAGILANLIGASARWDETRLRTFLHAFLAEWAPSEEPEPVEMFRDVASVFSVDPSVFFLAFNRVVEGWYPSRDIPERLFAAGELRDAVFEAFDALDGGHAEPALRLLETRADRLPDSRLAEMLPIPERGHEEEPEEGKDDRDPDADPTRDMARGLGLLGIAALLTDLYRGEAGIAELSVEQLVQLSEVETPHVPFAESLSSELARRDPAEVAASVVRAMETWKTKLYVLDHLVGIAGDLGFPELMDPICDLLAADSHFFMFSEKVAKAARKFGVPLLERIEARFDGLDDEGRKAALDLIRGMDRARVEAFLLDRFDIYWRLERRVVLDAAERLVSEAVLDRIHPLAGRDQSDIDRTFVLLAELLGRDFPELPAAWDAVFRAEARNRRTEEAMRAGDMEAVLTESPVRLPLRCGQCGAVNEYDVDRVILLFESRDSFFVAREYTCVDCGRTGAFEPAERAESYFRMLTILVTGFGMKDEPEKKKALLEKSILELVQVRVFGKSMAVPEALDAYEKAIREAPKNVGLRIGYGNILIQVGRPSRAEALFREALDMDPSFIQAHFGLATLAATRNDDREAFHWLEAGRRHWDDARMYAEFSNSGTAGGDLASLYEDYCDFYNQVAERLELKVPALRPPRDIPETASTGKKKVGRNDPCPCGSGKKFKKCCLRRVGRK
jgi:tetratricopeptide (TPR) repeat protein